MVSGMELLMKAAGLGDDASHSIVSSHHPSIGTVESRSVAAPSSSAVSPPRRSVSNASLPPKKRARLLSFRAGLGRGETITCNESFLPMLQSNRPTSGARVSAASSVGALSQGSDRTDAPTVNSEWTEMTTTSVARPRASGENGLLRTCGSIVVPNESVSRDMKWSGSSPSKMGGSRRKRSSLRVKDVDGNDVGMGYFSLGAKDSDGNGVGVGYFSAMLSCRRSPSPAATEIMTMLTKRAAADPRDANKEEEPKQGPKRSYCAPSHKVIVSNNAKATRSANESEKDADACVAARSLLCRAYLRALNQPDGSM